MPFEKAIEIQKDVVTDFTFQYIRRNLRDRISDLKKQIVNNSIIIPFKSQIDMLPDTYFISEDCKICVPIVRKQKIAIKRISYATTYALNYPINFVTNIYLVKSLYGSEFNFIFYPIQYGFHFIMDRATCINGKCYDHLCLGDMELLSVDINDFTSTKRLVKELVSLYENVNLYSIGKIHLPKRSVYNNYLFGSSNKPALIEDLLTDNQITKLI